MDKRKNVEIIIGPIIEDNKVIGYSFRENIEVYYYEEDISTWRLYSVWSIYPEGEYTFETQRSWENGEDPWDYWESDIDSQEGVFDSSKYKEYVEQMMTYRTDWKMGLKRTPWKKRLCYEDDDMLD